MNNRERNILEQLHDAGVELVVKGDQVVYSCLKGKLTPGLRAAIKEIKPSLIFEYNERAGILEYDANMPREQAEREAVMMIAMEEV